MGYSERIFKEIKRGVIETISGSSKDITLE